MSVSAHVHVGIIAKIDLKPSPYTVDLDSCSNTKCVNYGVSLGGKFCSACGGNIAKVKVKKYGKVGWYEFLEAHEGEGDDVLNGIPYTSDVAEFEILTHYEYKSDGPELDPDEGNCATLDELQKHSVVCKARFEEKHGDLIKAAQKFFGNRFSYDYGVCAYWS